MVESGGEGETRNKVNDTRILVPENSLSKVGTSPPHDSDTPHELAARLTTTKTTTTQGLYKYLEGHFRSSKAIN